MDLVLLIISCGNSNCFNTSIPPLIDEIFFSSASSTYSLNLDNGYVNWISKPRSSNNLIVNQSNIFLITDNGYLVNLNRNNGKRNNRRC